ncbi:hydroxymethylbutenyl pyrophosphate reductase [Deferribacter desulfuricans SSM1]|uniref:4-hydroxy-3-methylbut-2-enyl diphosphate reductase n=1 Tax=Deferribacter desulfuricans (strain DSM 14783 / JCM 11476 / NBRC 101012 / SSM1) TaxID=639282 RepID=D3PA04_DEFDS|nr:4-hydroxy-3-methylbut-2-enyl diphosphate reductase [Deferribacter desulfuricans]BAI81544.1 hydroxymethylbutenyl pyrophosphate reductase [Deferribacter desulfuricans SSM1]
MKILVAEHAGFCFGVERAVGIVEDTANKKSNVITLGPIIHNPQLVNKLKEKGVLPLENIDEVKDVHTVIIRSHGITKDNYELLKNKGVEIIDATCPFVIKAHNSAMKLSKEGYSVIVFGDKNHPEVKGIVSYVEGEYFLVSNSEEAKNLPFRKKYGLVAQTTQNSQSFEEVVSVVQDKCDELKVINTICNATTHRQEAAKEVAKQVDMMIVIGGKNSGNTRRLFEICSELCKNTVHIETKDELSEKMFENIEKVGITAGASTPDYLIKDVINYLEEVKNERERKENR